MGLWDDKSFAGEVSHGFSNVRAADDRTAAFHAVHYVQRDVKDDECVLLIGRM